MSGIKDTSLQAHLRRAGKVGAGEYGTYTDPREPCVTVRKALLINAADRIAELEASPSVDDIARLKKAWADYQQCDSNANHNQMAVFRKLMADLPGPKP